MKRLLAILLCCVISSAALAAEGEKGPAVSPWLFKKLTKTETLIAQKSYRSARESLLAMLKEVEKGGYEEATVLRSLSSVYALEENYRLAAEAMEKCLALKALPEQQQQQGIVNLGQLYLATEQYRKAVNILEPWLAKNPHPDAELSALLANAYAQLKRYRQALPHIEKAIASSKKPSESWYQLNLALYYELKEFAGAAKLLTHLIRKQPDNKDYWDQLSSVYQQLKRYKKAASIRHLAYRKGLLTSEKEVMDLINLYLYIGSPYKAATLLKAAMTAGRVRSNSGNLETLANAWLQAKEFDKAVSALERASAINEKGILYQRLGQIYVEREQWKKAVEAFNKAIARGGLKQLGETYLLLGMSHYELNNLKQARSAFNQARNYTKQKKSASDWLDFIENEAG